MGCRPLGECIESVIDHRGLTPKKLGGDWAHSGHRALSAKNIKNGALVQEGSMNRVSDEMYYRWMTEEVERGDVFITSEAPFGEVLYWDSDEKLVLSQRIFGLKVNRDICDSRYLYYWMRSPLFQGELRGRATGTTVTGLRQPELLKCMVNLPPRDAQAAIAHILGTIDDKIALNNRINGYLSDCLRNMAKNLYMGYERDKNELPHNWHLVKIGEIADLVCRGITPRYGKTSDEIVLGQTCIRNNLVIVENGRPHAPKKITEKWLKKNDLLINSTGVGSLGRTAQVWFNPDKLVVDSHITIVRAKNPSHALYLGFWAFGHEKYIESLHTGSTGQTELPRDRVKAIELVLPSEQELEEFNSVAKPSVELIVANQEENRRLTELRDGLLPRLMSGEIDVSKVDFTQLNSHLSDY